MKKACLVIDPPYWENRIFDLNDPHINRDDCAYPYFYLREMFRERQVDLATCDMHKPSDSDIILYLDMPNHRPDPVDAHRSYLLALESPLIKPSNFDPSLHELFRKVFTWDDRLADGRRYVKVNYSFRFTAVPPKRKTFADSKLVCMIAANKRASFPDELYSKRLEIIRWYQMRHAQDFDLYGLNWDRYHFYGSRLARSLNRLPWLTKALMPAMPAYRGPVASKGKVMGSYRFAFALENISGVPGYITEKIFDCFFAGCVPIYLGAPNIQDYISADAFIDMREYGGRDGLENLHDVLGGMTEHEWLGRLEAMRDFLSSDKAAAFSSERFARTVVDSVLGSSHG